MRISRRLDDALRYLLDRADFERHLHAAHGGEGVDEHWNGVALGLLEQQGGAAGLHGAVGELGDFEDGIDFEGDALQLAGFFQGAHEVAQIAVGHKL